VAAQLVLVLHTTLAAVLDRTEQRILVVAQADQLVLTQTLAVLVVELLSST
jgi:hypothetical protein